MIPKRDARRAMFMIGVICLLGPGLADADEADLVLVAATAGQSSVIVNRIVSSAYSETGDEQAVETFQQMGGEAGNLLDEIANECLAGRDLSVTRPSYSRVAQLVELARHVIEEAKIYVNPVDESQLSQLLSLLDRQYYPRPELPADDGLPLPTL